MAATPNTVPERKRLELARRVRVGALFHPLLLALVMGFTPVWRTFPVVSALMAVTTVGLAAIRVYLCARVFVVVPATWTRRFWATSLAVPFSWTMFASIVSLHYGLGPESLLVCLVSAGVTSGALSSLAADRWLARIFLCILIPPHALTLTLAGPAGIGMAIAMLVYLMFGLVQAGQNESAIAAAWINEDDLRRTAHSLQAATQRANEATRAKSSFIANMSHEIRTPLNGVLGHAQLLLDTSLDGDQKVHVRTLLSSGEHLLALLNDILDMSKIEAGQLKLEVRPTNLAQVLRDATATIRPLAARKGLAISFHIEPTLPAFLALDSLRVSQVLRNLLNNALKFTERGVISVNLGCERVGATQVRLRCEVSDTGVGIAPEVMPRLFTVFSQADASTTRRYGGSGLGLAVSKNLVSLMGGRIGVDSRAGEGSTFWIDLTAEVVEGLAAPTSAPSTAGASAQLEGTRVLLVEDSAVNQTVGVGLLKKLGCQVVVAGHGGIALERLRDERFDIVLMDCQMPIMDGYEATRRIRAMPEVRDIPILGVTAHAMIDDLRLCRDAGMNDHLTKPYRLSELTDALIKQLRPPAHSGGRPAAGITLGSTAEKVLPTP